MRKFGIPFLTVAIFLGLGLGIRMTCQAQPSSEALKKAQTFIDNYLSWYAPLEKEANLAWWDGATTGKEEHFAKAKETKDQIDAKLSDPTTFKEIESLHQSLENASADPLLARQIKILYLSYKSKQVPKDILQRITTLESEIEKLFNTYRAKVGGKELSANDIRSILKDSKDSNKRKEAWEGSKGVGNVVASKLIQLVEFRNKAAKSVGYNNYQEMALDTDEHDPKKLEELFDELDALTKDSFAKAKARMDAVFSKRYGLKASELRPWHYNDPFFQESQEVYDLSLDTLYTNKNLEKLTLDFYKGIGLPIADVFKNSDLYAKPGKSQHAFCTDIDRKGDVRMLANIETDDYWMGTMLHEAGHAVYFSTYIPQSIPFLLRYPSHTLTTEGIAMLFGRLPREVSWLDSMGLAPNDEKARNQLAKTAKEIQRDGLLIFSRWAQVMYRFEKALYSDPYQDLNKVWWDLVEKYQLVKRPENRDEPDWASKIHIAVAPVYYHNYLMGEIFASQVMHALAKELKGDSEAKVNYVGNEDAGKFLLEKVIKPANTMDWNDVTEFATGEPLNAKAYAKDVSN